MCIDEARHTMTGWDETCWMGSNNCVIQIVPHTPHSIVVLKVNHENEKRHPTPTRGTRSKPCRVESPISCMM